jgi:trehalose/maltose transport system permease protein
MSAGCPRDRKPPERSPVRSSPPGDALRRRRARTAWLFLLPALAVLLLVAGWPLLRTMWFSLTDARLSTLGSYGWAGLANYLAADNGVWHGLLADPRWWKAVRNTLVFTAASVSLETILGVAVALVLNASFRGRGWVRAAVMVPWAIPTIVSAEMWGWILHDQFGLLNDLLQRLGLIAEPLAWTADPGLALLSVVIVDVWKTTPFMALLVLAALQTLPKACYEAARVDGIPPVWVFFRITLPLISPALLVAVVFRTLDALRIFDLIYVLTPNSDETMSMSVYARQQLVDFQAIGYGSAASTMVFAIVATCTAAWLWIGRSSLAESPR